MSLRLLSFFFTDNVKGAAKGVQPDVVITLKSNNLHIDRQRSGDLQIDRWCLLTKPALCLF